MSDLQMPAAREFGWPLKPVPSSLFDICKRDNGQFCVVLNHALLRGVRAEMIHWWFLNFCKMKVRLRNVPGYEDKEVPGYWLWHPVDHLSATLSGHLGTDGTAKVGCTIHIREAMQYDVYGWKYPVDAKLKVFYVGEDGWAMGKVLPFFGPVMMLRIHFKDVFEGTQHLGVHYHYEIVIGVSGSGLLPKQINSKITGSYGPEFFAAWQRHNVIEVGTFENFIPALYDQRNKSSGLEYSPGMSSVGEDLAPQTAFSRQLFDQRLQSYRQSDDPSRVQGYDKASFL